MDLFRIGREKYIHDLSGEGARKFGGRWNAQGTAILYTSQHESLAALEILAHASVSMIPSDLNLLVLSIPGNSETDSIDPVQLPPGWRNYPAPNKLADIGNQWIESGSSLMLEVPSVLVQTEMNILINPNHSDADLLTIKEIRPFSFDMRLLQY